MACHLLTRYAYAQYLLGLYAMFGAVPATPQGDNTHGCCCPLGLILTPFSYTVRLSGVIPSLQVCLEWKADVHIFDQDRQTALHYAAAKGQCETARALVRTPSETPPWSLTPSLIENERSPLMHCIVLQVAAGANVNSLDAEDGRPLHWAAAKGQLEVCKVSQAEGRGEWDEAT